MTEEKKEPKRPDRIRGPVGDPNFPGLGKLKCQICGKPLRDHKISVPCPELDLEAGERMTVGSGRAGHKA